VGLERRFVGGGAREQTEGFVFGHLLTFLSPGVGESNVGLVVPGAGLPGG